MKRFKKELLLFVVVLVVAVAGLMQLFHEEAYAVGLCSTSCVGSAACNCEINCSNPRCACYDCTGGGSSPIVYCSQWCANQCPPPPPDCYDPS